MINKMETFTRLQKDISNSLIPKQASSNNNRAAEAHGYTLMISSLGNEQHRTREEKK